MIKKAAERALSRLDEFQPLQIEKPIKIEITFPNILMGDLVALIPGSERSSDKSVSYSSDDPNEVLKFSYAAILLSSQVYSERLMMKLEKNEEASKVINKFYESRIKRWVSR